MKYIWLFGENLGKTMDNNSWFYFEHIAATQDGLYEAYFILEKNSANSKRVSSLPTKVKRKIVWKNSPRHYRLYFSASMYYVTLSYKDIVPRLPRGAHYNIQPVVYLQHGTVAMKKIGYAKDAYTNSMFKFLTYGTNEADLMIKHNGFDRHQTLYSVAHPRYKELARIYRGSKQKKQILWFLTWREYINDGSVSESVFMKKVVDVLSDDKLKGYLRKSGTKIKLVLHQFFDKEAVFRGLDIDDSLVSVLHAEDTDLMRDIAESELLITDYSSLGFDFTFLRKPVMLYQFDSLIYATKREFCVDLERDLVGSRYTRGSDLVDAIVRGRYKLNKFFVDRLEKSVDLDAVERGEHIDKLHEYFKFAQANKVAFLGYNFYGRGGTVSATRALAEGLSEEGYLVELVSMKQIKSRTVFPGGVITRSFMKPWRSITESLKYKLFISQKSLSYLNVDVNRDLLIPYVGFALRRYLRKTNAKTVISTRETLHLFLDDADNQYLKNKLYFFHTVPDAIEGLFPGIMGKIMERDLRDVLFVTENSRRAYEDIFDYSSYERHVVTGNALASSDTIDVSEIEPVGETDVYRGIVLTRIAKDRIEDLRRIIDFGVYLKQNDVKNVEIDVFGMGDALYDFCDQIVANDLQGIVNYRGLTQDPRVEIQARDFLVDFSKSHTFGMIYLEAILNGVQCFAAKNDGSQEVLKGIPASIYDDWEGLLARIQNLKNVKVDRLVDNYKLLSDRYSRRKVAAKVKTLLDS